MIISRASRPLGLGVEVLNLVMNISGQSRYVVFRGIPFLRLLPVSPLGLPAAIFQIWKVLFFCLSCVGFYSLIVYGSYDKNKTVIRSRRTILLTLFGCHLKFRNVMSVKGHFKFNGVKAVGLFDFRPQSSSEYGSLVS